MPATRAGRGKHIGLYPLHSFHSSPITLDPKALAPGVHLGANNVTECQELLATNISR